MQPRIINRREHAISRKQLSTNALHTLYRLRDHGFIAYLVGGCVRDLLLERVPKDFDIATDATPGQIKKIFRNCRLVGRRFRLAHLQFDNEIIEVSTFRASAISDDDDTVETTLPDQLPLHLKDESGMVLRDNLFGSPWEDALRRDFTINALAYNIADFSVIDYTNGLTDLRQRIIRPIGDPIVRFTEDPVRMIRAVRFAATLGFDIEQETWNVIRDRATTITRAAPARLYEEMQKLFLLGAACPVFVLMAESGLLMALFPWLARWLYRGGARIDLMHAALNWLDSLVRNGIPPTPPLLLAALFGPSLEERLIDSHRDGIPHQQALHATCAEFLEELRKTVTVPARVSNQMRGILALQPSLHKVPPRRPQALVDRHDFTDAFAYLKFMADTRGENRTSSAWWDAYLSGVPFEGILETKPEKAPVRRRRKRRRRRPASKTES